MSIANLKMLANHISIVAVVNSLSGRDDIQYIRDYSHKMNIMFETRAYDSKKHSVDRCFVKNLPAFHIYIKKGYVETFYLDTHSIEVIDKTIKAYLLADAKRIKNRQMWRNLSIGLVKSLQKLFTKSKPLRGEIHRVPQWI
jgi:hypothetical protein